MSTLALTLAVMQRGLNAVASSKETLEAASIVGAKIAVREEEFAPSAMQKGMLYWQERKAANSASDLLMGGKEGKAFFASEWQKYLEAQEKPLLENALAHARASPMAGMGLRAAPYALSQTSQTAWARTMYALNEAPKAEVNEFKLPSTQRDTTQKVALVPLRGMLQYRPGLFAMYFGATGLELFASRMRMLADDETVKKIIVLAGSGGGECLGVSHGVEAVRYATSKKSVTAYVETNACSAAYWIVSQCSDIVASEATEIGSLGVIAPMIDDSKWLEEAGVKYEWVRKGDKKALGQSGEPIDDAQREDLTRRVDEFYSLQMKDVALGRKRSEEDVRNLWGDSSVYGSNRALELGLIDKISTLERLLEKEARQ